MVISSTRIYSTALLLWLSPLLLAVGGRGCGGSDEGRLQGRWLIVEVLSNGHAEGGVGGFFTFDNGKMTGNSKDGSEEGWYRLVPDTEPKGIDLGTEKEEYSGIYVLEGDELTLCFNDKNELVRPSSFSSEKGSRNVLIRLKRIE